MGCSNRGVAYSDESGLGVTAALPAESVRPAGFALLSGLEAAFAFATGPPALTGGFNPPPFTGGAAVSLSSVTSRMGATN